MADIKYFYYRSISHWGLLKIEIENFSDGAIFDEIDGKWYGD